MFAEHEACDNAVKHKALPNAWVLYAFFTLDY